MPMSNIYAEYTQKEVSRIVDEINTKKLILDPFYQRNEGLWNENDQRKLIITILYDKYPIPPIMISDRDSYYNTIDGKQRCSTLRDFMNNCFQIEVNEVIDGVHYKKLCYYSDLSIADRILFDNIKIPIQKYLNMSDIDECRAYERLNRGRPMKSGEIILSYQYSEFAKIVKEYSDENSDLSQTLQDIWKVKYPSMDRRYNILAMFTALVAGLMKGTSFTTTSYRTLQPLLEKEEFDNEEIQTLQKNISRLINIWQSCAVTIPAEWKRAGKIWKLGHILGYMIHSLWTTQDDAYIINIWKKFIIDCCRDTTIYKKWDDAINIPAKNLNCIRLNRGWELIKSYFDTNKFITIDNPTGTDDDDDSDI
jgi:hypothetical protein